MALPNNWLIATNGTKYASKAVVHAGTLYASLPNKPKVTILVVAHDEEGEFEATEILSGALDEFDGEAHSKEEVDLEVRVGNAAEVILRTAKDLSIDQLFIGAGDFKYDINAPGQGGISNKLLNSFHGVITLVR